MDHVLPSFATKNSTPSTHFRAMNDNGANGRSAGIAPGVKIGSIHVPLYNRELYITVLPLLRFLEDQAARRRGFVQNEGDGSLHTPVPPVVPFDHMIRDFGISYTLSRPSQRGANRSAEDAPSGGGDAESLGAPSLCSEDADPSYELTLSITVPDRASTTNLERVERALARLYGAFAVTVFDVCANGSYTVHIRLDKLLWNYKGSSDVHAKHLSMTRVHILGAGIREGLEALMPQKSNASGNGDDDVDDILAKALAKQMSIEAKVAKRSVKAPPKSTAKMDVHCVRMYPSHGMCYCIASKEKFMAIFVVEYDDELEWALARRFLMQFQSEQRSISQSPHCEFRRPDDVSQELSLVMSLMAADSMAEAQDGTASGASAAASTIASASCCGYLSFTFFPSHVATPQRALDATCAVVNFLPYLDKHVKRVKLYIHSRMRQNKDDLLQVVS